LQKLGRVGFGAFPPLLMAILNKEEKEKTIFKVLQSCERFSFLIFQVSKRQSNTKNSHFYRQARKYYFDILSIKDINNDIEWSIDGEDDDHYYGELEIDRFYNHIEELFKKKEGFYSWNGIRYFLYEYELLLQEKANGNAKIEWVDFNKRKKENTIEHIYPQTPKDKCWVTEFSSYKKIDRKILLHNLGNLLLLAHSKNSELQNFCFSYKVKHTNKNDDEVGFFNGSYSEIEVSNNDNWTSKEIINRGKSMLSFLEIRWGINFEEWDMKKSDILLVNKMKS
jgi:hypothetical protein